MRIALGIEYNGSKFFGWQKQPDRISVQSALEQALSQFAGENINIIAAGRTDTGVHALEQVIHFNTNVNRQEFSWARGVNSFLHKNGHTNISIMWAKYAENFHARFDAVARTYYYVLNVDKFPPACFRGQVGYYMSPNNLDVESMQKAANFLLGKHDFSSFRASICQAKTPIKTMYKLNIQQSRNFYIFEIKANAFLHHMVRNIVGCLLKVGTGAKDYLWLQEVLLAKNRKKAAPTFMPDGLYLAHIEYVNIVLPQQKLRPWFID